MSTTEQNQPGHQPPRLPLPPKHWYITPYSKRRDDDPGLPYKPIGRRTISHLIILQDGSHV